MAYLLTLLNVIILPGIGASNEHDFELLLVPAVERQEEDLNQPLGRGWGAGTCGDRKRSGTCIWEKNVSPTHTVPHAVKCLRVGLSACFQTDKGTAWLSIVLSDQRTKRSPQPDCCDTLHHQGPYSGDSGDSDIQEGKEICV